jgi:hypothetical protein
VLDPVGRDPAVRAAMRAGKPIKFSFLVNDAQGAGLMELGRERSVAKRNASFQWTGPSTGRTSYEFGWGDAQHALASAWVACCCCGSTAVAARAKTRSRRTKSSHVRGRTPRAWVGDSYGVRRRPNGFGYWVQNAYVDEIEVTAGRHGDRRVEWDEAGRDAPFVQDGAANRSCSGGKDPRVAWVNTATTRSTFRATRSYRPHGKAAASIGRRR